MSVPNEQFVDLVYFVGDLSRQAVEQFDWIDRLAARKLVTDFDPESLREALRCFWHHCHSGFVNDNLDARGELIISHGSFCQGLAALEAIIAAQEGEDLELFAVRCFVDLLKLIDKIYTRVVRAEYEAAAELQ